MKTKVVFDSNKSASYNVVMNWLGYSVVTRHKADALKIYGAISKENFVLYKLKKHLTEIDVLAHCYVSDPFKVLTLVLVNGWEVETINDKYECDWADQLGIKWQAW